MKKTKKLMALFLALLMTFSMLPGVFGTTAYAEHEGHSHTDVNNPEHPYRCSLHSR